MWKTHLGWIVSAGVISCLFIVCCKTDTLAEVIPDQTLGAETSKIVPDTINGFNIERIDGGAIREHNLFHSFREFNINVGEGVYFSSPAQVQNIFTRVTGELPSSILGTLGVLGNADLFLMNPQGIIFGKNANLDVKGSFLATTANNIQFADGKNFSAIQPQNATLLTVSAPIGLGLDNNSGSINVQGTGHTLAPPRPVFAPLIGAGISQTGLRVQPGKTLALIGGNINLTGGVLTANSGNIELGSINSGVLSLSPTSTGWNLDYNQVNNFKDIEMRSRSLADASGVPGGSIQIQSRNLSVFDGSAILIQNQGLSNAGEIKIKAAELVELNGASPNGINHSGLFNETVTNGNGGEINVDTPQLLLKSGGAIYSRTFGAGASGQITVNAPDWIQLIEYSPNFLPSAISSATFTPGKAGDVRVSTRNLTILDGGIITSSTLGTGAGGDVNINATNSIEMVGVTPIIFQPSVIGATAFNQGDAGDLFVNTKTLSVRDGARVNAATLASGAAGSVTVKASESITVSGTVPGSINPSLIDSSANIVDEVLQKILGVPPIPSGDSGNVEVSTPKLQVINGGLINARNDGTGDAGNLTIKAEHLFLDTKGGITAATRSGEGGNITMQLNSLQMRHNSSISATAGGTGNGGNINLTTSTVVALENSNITANAIIGNGGRININSSGIFRSTDSDINASSELGINGIVEVKTLDFDVKNTLTALTGNFVNPDSSVAGSCLARRNVEQGSLIVTGTGGLATTPYQAIRGLYPVSNHILNTNTLSTTVNQTETREAASWKKGDNHTSSLGDRIIEAQALIITPDGRTLLGKLPTAATLASNIVCH